MSKRALHVIWVNHKADEYQEAVACWDEFALADNYDGWLNEIESVRKQYDSAETEIREMIVRIPESSVAALFSPGEVDGEVAA